MHHRVDNYKQSDWIMVQVPVNNFLSVNIATTGPLEATPGMSQVQNLLSVNIATPGGSQVHSRWVPAECEPSFTQDWPLALLHVYA